MRIEFEFNTMVKRASAGSLQIEISDKTHVCRHADLPIYVSSGVVSRHRAHGVWLMSVLFLLADTLSARAFVSASPSRRAPSSAPGNRARRAASAAGCAAGRRDGRSRARGF